MLVSHVDLKRRRSCRQLYLFDSGLKNRSAMCCRALCIIDNDEAHSAIVWKWGVRRPMTKEMYCHHELLWMIDGYEPERGRRVAGHRGYFLKGNAVVLNQALIMYAMQWNRDRGFTLLQTPYFMNKDVMSGVAQLEDFDESLYEVNGEEDRKSVV